MRYLSVCSGIEAATVGDVTRFKEWPDAVVDVLVGGTPCQSFSVAGLRRGLADPRGNLALTYLAILDRYRPKWCLWENVPGVLSTHQGRALGAFVGGLGELGYGYGWRVLDAQYFGLAQRRARLFLVGHLGGWQRPAAVLLERACLLGHPAPRRETGEAITSSPGGIAGSCSSKWSKGTGGPAGDECYNLIALQDTRNHDKQQGGIGVRPDGPMFTLDGMSRHGVAHSLRADGFDASEDGTGRGTPLVPVGFYANEGSHGSADGTGISQTLKGTARASNLAAVAFDVTQLTHPENRSNPQPGDPCPPLAVDAKAPLLAFADVADPVCANQGRTYTHEGNTFRMSNVAHTAMQVRRLTPRECERLQGFPDDYTLIIYRGKPAADGPRYKALGNSMAVPVMRWLGERIAAVEAIQEEDDGHDR